MTLSDWKSLAITQEFMAELNIRLELLGDELISSAGVYPHLDSYRSGAISALKDVVNFHFENEETRTID